MSQSRKGVVVIPAYGRVDLTQRVIDQCLLESDIVHVVVVDNAGTFFTDSDVEVIVPGRNSGWLGGTNIGFGVAAERDVPWCVSLNNDTVLSRGFFDGLERAISLFPNDLVAPCYDDVVQDQNRYYDGPAEEFVPVPRDHEATLIDGTCFAMSRALMKSVGLLDARHFGRHGWGAIDDLVLRVRAVGGTCRVTQRSYLQHQTGSTAKAVMSSYGRYAYAEMRRGMRKKWGLRWRSNFPQLAGPPDTIRVRVGDRVRDIEERLRLTETWIGRR